MHSTGSMLLVTLFLQFVGAASAASVMLVLHAQYGSSYLRQWGRSWSAYAYMLLITLVCEWSALLYPGATWLPASMTYLHSILAYSQVALMVAGALELRHDRMLGPRTLARLLVASAALGVFVSLVFNGPRDSGWYFAGIMLRTSTITVASAIAAVAVWLAWHRGASTRGKRGLGWRFVFIALMLFAAQQLLEMGGAIMVYVHRGAPVTLLALSNLASPVLMLALGLGLVVWFLEEERQTSRDASHRVRVLSSQDSLTGLANRQQVLAHIADASRLAHSSGHHLALLYLDVDRFRLVIDSLGQAVADRVLIALAQRVVETLRTDETVARVGTDEFLVLLPQVRDEDDALAVARHLRTALHRPLLVDDQHLVLTVSIGVMVHFTDHADTPESLVQHAESALFRARAQGPDSLQLFSAHMSLRTKGELAFEQSLRGALTRGEIVVHFQPVVDGETGGIVGAEALVRWQHPELGLLGPDRFVPVAEATGLIYDIGEWVLRESCGAVNRWRSLGLPGMRAQVNVSVRQLQHDHFVDVVKSALSDSGLPPDALELEITESMAMRGEDDVLERLRALKRLGVRIAIDDFGTGYSSLSALRLFPVDALKIDRSFVRFIGGTIDGTAIATAVIAMAHALNLFVIAEGVENEEQLAFLRAQQCDAWQGYLCGPAVSAGEFERSYVETATMANGQSVA